MEYDESKGMQDFEYYWNLSECMNKECDKGISARMFSDEWRRGSPDDGEDMIMETF